MFQLPLKTVDLLVPLAAPGFVPVVRNVGLDRAEEFLSLQHAGDVVGGLAELLLVIL